MSNFEVQHIEKIFTVEGSKQTALQDVNLAVTPGEFLCLMGPSGCGKSTLLRIMAGLEKPTSGQVLNRPERIGFVFQSFGLMPWLNVQDNIAYGLKMYGISAARRRAAASKQGTNLGLGELLSAHPRELSGGQRQRVGLARALAINPAVMILDEPFSALDAFTARELREDLLQIWKTTGKTIVMVSHLAEEAVMLADRILVFSDRPGTIIHEINNKLPRPRAQRSPEFFKLVDRLESYIKAD